MSNQTTEDLATQLESLQQELLELRTAKAAADAQRELLENLVALARSPSQGQVLKATLQNTFDVCTQLTAAERGSLFLYDNNGAIVASILTRKDATPAESTALIGKVLDEGLAGWVSRERQVGLILDTDLDHRWINLPNQPYKVSSALAVPITRGDHLLGVLTLLHSEPHFFNERHAHLMQATADQIALVLENAELYSKLDESYTALEKVKEKLANELETGRKIQLDFLPDSLIQPPGWEIAACFNPARQLAGDFYDAFPLPGGFVGLVIADVCDKGVGAALFMALFRSLIRIFSGQAILRGFAMLDTDDPDIAIKEQIDTNTAHMHALKAISLTNNYIAQTSQLSMFATTFFGVLDPNTGLLSYVNGGHELPIIIGKSGVKMRLKPTGPAVGMFPDAKFKTNQVQLEPGDMLIGYTDGVPEAHSPDGTFFSEEKLLSLVEHPADTAAETIERIVESLRLHIADRDQYDDITLLILRWASPPDNNQ